MTSSTYLDRLPRSLADTLEGIQPPDKEAMKAASDRQDRLTKPQGSLGRLEELSIRIAGITGQAVPVIEDKAIITMAADHGVVAEGISAYPQEVTAQMVGTFLRGRAAVNVLAEHVAARVVVVDMGVATDLTESTSALVSRRIGPGTRNIARGPAMTREDAQRAIEVGMQVLKSELARGLDIVGLGDMGIGNTTPSSAICAVLTGAPIEEITGRGTGIDDDRLRCKANVIARAISATQPNPHDPLDVLSKVGGFEIAGLAGVILGAGLNRIPVVLDGFISGAAGLIATSLSPRLKDYLIASHVSAEPGHAVMLRHMGLHPLLDLGIRLGEGTGAALGIGLAEASTRILSQMATFEEAGVSEAPQ